MENSIENTTFTFSQKTDFRKMAYATFIRQNEMNRDSSPLKRLAILSKLYGDHSSDMILTLAREQWHYCHRCNVVNDKISRLILSSLVKTLLTRRLARALDRFDLCTNNFPSLNVRPVYLFGITSEREHGENHQKLVSEFKREQRPTRRSAVPLNVEIIIVPIFICQFLAAVPCPIIVVW